MTVFGSWQSLAGVLLSGACAYGALFVFCGSRGSRMLAEMNAFEPVVTVALGSTLASVLLPSDAGLTEP